MEKTTKWLNWGIGTSVGLAVTSNVIKMMPTIKPKYKKKKK